jgi:hypothetical protein
MGLVEYTRDGLLYCHWVSGELIHIDPISTADVPG